MGELLDMLISMSPIKTFEKRVDPARLRPSDVVLLHGDCTKFTAATGWKPEFSLRHTMHDLLNAWRKKYKIA